MDSTNSYKFEKDSDGKEMTVQDKLDRYKERLNNATKGMSDKAMENMETIKDKV